MTRWSYDPRWEPHDRLPGNDTGPNLGRVGNSPSPSLRERPWHRTNARASARLRIPRPLPDRRHDLPLTELSHLTASRERQPLASHGRAESLTGRQIQALATIGTFRAIPADDLLRHDLLDVDELRTLETRGLVHTAVAHLRGAPTRVVAITDSTRDLLTAQRDLSHRDRSQIFHAGLVKLAEISHDAELYALYQIAAEELEARGARVRRVVTDDELKHDYQAFLNRPDRPADSPEQRAADRRAWAELQGLQLVDDELQLPDLRIEYVDREGRFQTDDVELATPHYSARSLAAKARAGFAIYRASGRSGGRRGLRGERAGAKGSRPPDARLFERLR